MKVKSEEERKNKWRTGRREGLDKLVKTNFGFQEQKPCLEVKKVKKLPHLTAFYSCKQKIIHPYYTM